MECELTEFQYFINLFWPFFVGALAVRVICGFWGDVMYWMSVAFGDRCK